MIASDSCLAVISVNKNVQKYRWKRYQSPKDRRDDNTSELNYQAPIGALGSKYVPCRGQTSMNIRILRPDNHEPNIPNCSLAIEGLATLGTQSIRNWVPLDL